MDGSYFAVDTVARERCFHDSEGMWAKDLAKVDRGGELGNWG